MLSSWKSLKFCLLVNPLPHTPILGSSNSAANKNTMSKIWTNMIQLSDWVKKRSWEKEK